MRSAFLILLSFSISLAAFSQNKAKEIESTGPEINYNGGTEKMYKKISENLVYPESAVKDSVAGTVYLSLIIDKKGRVEKVKVIKGIRKDLDAEAVRVAYKLDDFTPAKVNGKPVKVKVSLPIKFVITN